MPSSPLIHGLFAIFIPVYLFLLLPILASLGGDTTRFLERASEVQWGLMIAVYCVSAVPALLTLDTTAIGGRGISGGILGDGGEDFLPRLRARLERENLHHLRDEQRKAKTIVLNTARNAQPER